MLRRRVPKPPAKTISGIVPSGQSDKASTVQIKCCDLVRSISLNHS